MPHGPSIENTSLKSKILKVLLKELKSIAKKEKADFIRISPIWERTEENKKIFKDLDFRTGPIHIHPEVTWELDIKKPEDSVLMEMRKTTRYLIRQALKNKDIVIKQGKNLKDLKLLNKVYKETAKRHHFAPFSFDYLRNEFNVFSHDDQIILLLGKYKNEVVSGSMIVFWQDMAFYHQGASLLKYSRIPVSYLMQWEAIKQAQKRKCNLYNFWGIADIEEGFKIQNLKHKKHPWWGLSLFKMGFGGQKKEYVKTQDFPLSKKYWLTFVFEKLRKLKRDRKSTRLNSSHIPLSRMPSSA